MNNFRISDSTEGFMQDTPEQEAGVVHKTLTSFYFCQIDGDAHRIIQRKGSQFILLGSSHEFACG
jgi:hypothetical protein